MPEEQKTDALSAENFTVQEPVAQEPIDFNAYYVEPHQKISREVTNDDVKRLMEDAHIMYNLCYTQSGRYSGPHYGVAHAQINDTDPLRFFVTAAQEIIINPKITRHTKTTVDSVEGCLSFQTMPMVKVQRYNKCEVEYQILNEDMTLSEPIQAKLSGKGAFVYQHEIDHMDAKYIYD